MEEIRLNTIDEAIADFREGNFVIVVDDEDRENEGDFIIAAEKITPEKVNFMMTHGRGVLCAPITEAASDVYKRQTRTGCVVCSYYGGALRRIGTGYAGYCKYFYL